MAHLARFVVTFCGGGWCSYYSILMFICDTFRLYSKVRKLWSKSSVGFDWKLRLPCFATVGVWIFQLRQIRHDLHAYFPCSTPWLWVSRSKLTPRFCDLLHDVVYHLWFLSWRGGPSYLPIVQRTGTLSTATTVATLGNTYLLSCLWRRNCTVTAVSFEITVKWRDGCFILFLLLCPELPNNGRSCSSSWMTPKQPCPCL